MLKKNKQSKHQPIRKRNPVVVALLTNPKRNAGRHGKANNVRSKQVELKKLLDDPRSDPDSSWHEQWLIDVQDLDEKYGG